MIKEYYQSGQLNIVDKKGNDYCTAFFESGKIQSERQLESGYYKIFRNDGTLKIVSNYKDYQLGDQWLNNFANGNLNLEVSYKDGLKNGTYKLFQSRSTSFT